ncbi:hypothetical protein BCR36DRAFT_65517 [Piromyces finnis]|uniref:Right handed beta helix domain-containing protein n=1 Tax=Piromyces finnis TaxID=1754191 RepID=A0A1Y1V8C9_9FUNG|nr:hypothetical protein BCR36DRAFT_65517 [Piromyces finnis]|eukprot:ORX49708.1 hypothetical protein BCR36DRAFT_65517 [Piromyces finnis]
MTHYPNGLVQINKVNLYTYDSTQDHGLVLRHCNTTINNSILYGNNQYHARLINFSGDNTHYLKILNTFVDGKYLHAGLSMSVSNLQVYNSTFINTYSGNSSYGGSVFNLDKVNAIFNNTIVKNAYSINNGGIFYLSNFEKTVTSENLDHFYILLVDHLKLI